MSIGLQLANRNDYVSVQDHINNNLTNLEEMIDNNSGKKITGYIQDSGEKILGNYYLDKLTTGLFKCIKSGNINYNSSEYFENDSNYALSDKLQNLELVTESKGISNSIDMVATLSIYGKIAIITGCAYAGTSTRTFTVSGSHEMPTPKKQTTTTWSSLHNSMYLIQLTLKKDKTFSVTKAELSGTEVGIFNFSLVYEIE